MNYPKWLEKGDRIAVVSPSNGVVKEKKLSLLGSSKNYFISNGFDVIEDKYTRCSVNGESAPAIKRSLELKKYLKDDTSAIITVSGGDYCLEVLDYLNVRNIKNKIIQGQSDSTILTHYITTKYDLATIYSCNFTSFGKNSELENEYNLNALRGKRIIQKSFNKDEAFSWKLLGKDKIDISGRIIGGCLPCLLDVVGTKYDYTNKFLNRYKNDNIIWYFDIDYMTNEDILRGLWHLRNAGWFKNTNCIIFGRVEEESFTGITLEQAIKRGINDSNVNIITNADIGHTNPRITILNGGYAYIKYENNKAEIIFEEK